MNNVDRFNIILKDIEEKNLMRKKSQMYYWEV